METEEWWETWLSCFCYLLHIYFSGLFLFQLFISHYISFSLWLPFFVNDNEIDEIVHDIYFMDVVFVFVFFLPPNCSYVKCHLCCWFVLFLFFLYSYCYVQSFHWNSLYFCILCTIRLLCLYIYSAYDIILYTHVILTDARDISLAVWTCITTD